MKSMKMRTSSQPTIRKLIAVLGLAVLSFIVPNSSFAQTLSPGAQMSLLTVGPGEDLYSVFGHTAIRVNDPARNLDVTFGWGGFRYQEYFYVKFLRSILPYYIDAYEMYPFLYAYQRENRTVREQVLNLSPTQKERLFAVLQTNMLPENRTYQYKFFYDNCSTRPRDKITEACADSLTIPSRSVMTGKSYRDWMNDYLGEKPWAKLGMNLAIGRPADVQTDGWHAMYLPENVYNQMVRATIRQANGALVPLVARDQTLFQAAKTFPYEIPFIFEPNVVFTLLGIVVALFTVRRYRQGRIDHWVDRLLFGVVGFLGWFLFLLWVATDHGVTAWNPTLLWLFPLHLPLIFWVTRPDTTGRRRINYFGLTAVLVVAGMVLSTVPGGVDVVFPLTLLIRCLVNISYPVRRQQLTTEPVA